MFPAVNISIENGSIGGAINTNDGITGLVLTGTGTVDIPLLTPKVVFTLEEAESLGITEAAQPSAYRQIKEYYDAYEFITGSRIAELYIILASSATTMTNLVDSTTSSAAKTLLQYSKGRISLLGVTRTPAVGYTPTVTDGIDADVLTAIPKAQILANSFASAQAPIRVLLEGLFFKYEDIGDLKDLTTLDNNRVGVVLWSTTNSGSSVGYTLGMKSALPVQRKLSRVKNGALPITTAFIGDTPVDEVSALETIHDKGYITLRNYPTRSGYFFTGEPMACAPADDYSILSRGMVIDKAQRIAYAVFLDEVEEDVEVDENGELHDGYKHFIESKVVDAIKYSMEGNISGEAIFYIVPGQNIVTSHKTDVVLKVTPKGYQTQLNVKLSFNNPASASSI